MNRRTKTWLIIGVDIMLVLAVYMLYVYHLQPLLERPTGPVEMTTRHEGIYYRLEAQPHPETRRMLIKFEISNPRGDTATVDIPEGVRIMLYDGAEYIFAQELIVPPTSFDLGRGDKKDWSHHLRYPQLDVAQIFVGYFIDDRRQKQTAVELPPPAD